MGKVHSTGLARSKKYFLCCGFGGLPKVFLRLTRITHQDGDVDVLLICDARKCGAEGNLQAITWLDLNGAALGDEGASSFDLNLQLMRFAVACVDGTVIFVQRNDAVPGIIILVHPFCALSLCRVKDGHSSVGRGSVV